MSSTFGAPLGGTTFAGQPGLDSTALRLILPAKGAGGFGMYLPSIVVVAAGEPGVPVVCTWAWAEGTTAIAAATNIPLRRMCPFVFMDRCCFLVFLLRGKVRFAGEVMDYRA